MSTSQDDKNNQSNRWPSLGEISTAFGLIGLVIAGGAKFLSTLHQSQNHIYDKIIMIYDEPTTYHYLWSALIVLLAAGLALVAIETAHALLKKTYFKCVFLKLQERFSQKLESLWVRFIAVLVLSGITVASVLIDKPTIFVLFIITICIFPFLSPKIPYRFSVSLCSSIFLIIFVILALVYDDKNYRETVDVIAYTEIVGFERIEQRQMIELKGKNVVVQDKNGSKRSIPFSAIKFVDLVQKPKDASPVRTECHPE